MKNNNINWGLLVGVVIVVAVVASVISARITGNVIKVKQDKFGKFQVYTKAEIDEKIGSLIVNGSTLTIDKDLVANSANINHALIDVITIDGTGIYGEIGRDIVIAPGHDFLVTSRGVRFSSISGQGNAYVCVTPQGALYRSLTTCG